MGWMEYTATKYNKNGTVNRKAECDAYFMEDMNEGWYKIEASAMKGSVYYAAVTPLKRMNGKIEEAIPAHEQKTFAVVMLTSAKRKGIYSNFAYKLMDESMGPRECDCPKKILKLLSPTESEWANEWRKKCEENQKKVSLSSLAVGTKIKWNGKILEKCAPAYQFKTAFWMNRESGTYVPKNRITSFEIIV